MKRPRIYISGPITLGDKEYNLQQSQVAQKALMVKGYAPFNPMLTISLPWEDKFSHNTWLESDYPWVEVSDGLLRLPGESVGADLEIEHARDTGVPVFYDMDELEHWFSMDGIFDMTAECGSVDKDVAGGDGGCKDAESPTPALSPIETLMATHDRLSVKAKSIMEAKNNDYTCGSADPYANFRAAEAIGVSPVQGLLMRMMDKIQRANSFDQMGGLQVKSEPVEDICLDILNYAVLLRGLLAEKEG